MLKTFSCKECGKTFQKEMKSSYVWYCDDCRKERKRRDAYERAVKSGRIKKPGVGSGGNQWGENNHNWSGYKAEYSYTRIIRKENMKECYFCGSKENLCRHHIDKNRSNNTKDNLMVVCRSCHAKLHGLITNITSRSKTSLIQGKSKMDNPELSHNVESATTNPDECRGVGSSESKCEALQK